MRLGGSESEGRKQSGRGLPKELAKREETGRRNAPNDEKSNALIKKVGRIEKEPGHFRKIESRKKRRLKKEDYEMRCAWARREQPE